MRTIKIITVIFLFSTVITGCVSKVASNQLQVSLEQIIVSLPGQQVDISTSVQYSGGEKSNIIKVEYVSATNPSNFEQLLSRDGTLYKEITIIIRSIGINYHEPYDRISITALPENYVGRDSLTMPIDYEKVQEILATPEGELIRYFSDNYYQ